MTEITDGTGNCYGAKVSSNNKLFVVSESWSLQHAISEENQLAFQLLTTSSLSAGTVVAMHLRNTNETKNMVVTFIRHQIIGAAGGTAFPNISNYFTIASNRKHVSGGVEITPVNVFVNSGITSGILAHNSNPTLTGTPLEIDRWYTKENGDMNTFDKDGALIVPPGQDIEFSYIGDQTSGTIYTRVSFVMEEPR